LHRADEAGGWRYLERSPRTRHNGSSCAHSPLGRADRARTWPLDHRLEDLGRIDPSDPRHARLRVLRGALTHRDLISSSYRPLVKRPVCSGPDSAPRSQEMRCRDGAFPRSPMDTARQISSRGGSRAREGDLAHSERADHLLDRRSGHGRGTRFVHIRPGPAIRPSGHRSLRKMSTRGTDLGRNDDS
jgi:hypothetical protein